MYRIKKFIIFTIQPESIKQIHRRDIYIMDKTLSKCFISGICKTIQYYVYFGEPINPRRIYLTHANYIDNLSIENHDSDDDNWQLLDV